MKEIVKRDLILKTDPETNEQYWTPGLKTVIKPMKMTDSMQFLISSKEQQRLKKSVGSMT